jgi:hypothetical protein
MNTGCWEIEVTPAGKISYVFLPIKSPKFIIVTSANMEEVLAQEFDPYNYYDFRLNEPLAPEEYQDLKARFPNSYMLAQTVRKESSITHISSRQGVSEILERYYDARIKGEHKTDFVAAAIGYLTTAAPTLTASGFKQLEILWVKAQNFLVFEDIMVDLRKLEAPIYMVTGTSDEETSVVNGIGKSALAVEILAYTLFDKLTRSGTRSKDRFIHDPAQTGKAKGLITEAGIMVNGVTYIIQRYRKHPDLGSGSRVLAENKE